MEFFVQLCFGANNDRVVKRLKYVQIYTLNGGYYRHRTHWGS